MSLVVEAPGLLTTVQDLGRPGYQHLGVGPGGAMDELSHRLANLLVGNPPDAPALEITLAGPALRFETDALVALCGGDLSAEMDGLPMPLWRPVLVRANSRLSFGRPHQGARCTLAVQGGFDVPKVLGSASTDLAAGFGGWQGRALAKVDRLTLGPASLVSQPALRRRFALGQSAFLGTHWFAPWFQELDFDRPCVLRMVEGPQWPSIAKAGRARFLQEPYVLTPASDRMGLRLQGPKLVLQAPLEMISAGVAMGTLQLPPDGQPILLMADRQTTGGYPRVGEVISVDLPKAAQLRPGEAVRFRTVSLEEAQSLYLHREQWFRELEAALAERGDDDAG